MFAVKYQVQGLADQLAGTVKQADGAERDIRVLDAEWAYLEPARCAGSDEPAFLSLVPIATKQLRSQYRRYSDAPGAADTATGRAARNRRPTAPTAIARRHRTRAGTLRRQRAASRPTEASANRWRPRRSKRRSRPSPQAGGSRQGGRPTSPATPGGVAQRADRPNRGEPVMSAAFQFDDNPCRPRHFKPPPCTPVVPDGPAKRALDGSRPRLFVASLAFISPLR